MKKLMINMILFFSLVASSWQVFAQRAFVDEFASRNGRIDTINEEERLIVIDGNRYEFREAEITVTYNGESIDAIALEEGQRISYRPDAEGGLSEIRLLSRLRLEEQPNNH